MSGASPIPISFAVMLAAIVALIIFFGAWVVSADAEQRERSFAAAIAGATTGLGAGPISPSLPAGQGTPAASEEGGSKADTWWGKTLLKTCPLH
jgi:predicted permease